LFLPIFGTGFDEKVAKKSRISNPIHAQGLRWPGRNSSHPPRSHFTVNGKLEALVLKVQRANIWILILN
ncbi:MAG: hypothetical protein ACXIU2_11480, partial [Cyclobacteriaceae bacterium]